VKLWSIFDRATDVLAIAGAVILTYTIVAISYDVFSRYLLNRPLLWVFETGEYALLYITYLGAAWVMRDDKHIKVDVVLNRLPPKVKLWVSIITSIIVAASLLLVTWAGINITLYSIEHHLFYHSIMRPPKAIMTGIVPLACLLLFIQFLRRIYAYFKGWEVSPEETDEVKGVG